MTDLPVITTDPARYHGEPVISRLRLPVSQVASAISNGQAVASYCDDYALTREQVLVALWHAGTYGLWETSGTGKRKRKTAPRWLSEWATEYEPAMWRGDWQTIPDPTITEDA